MGLLKLLSPVSPDLEKALKGEDKSNQAARELKSWQADPFAFLESVTHKERPGSLSFEQLRAMSYRCDVVSAILATRISQVASFCEPQVDRHHVGYAIAMRDSQAPGSKAATKQSTELVQFIHNCGSGSYGQDGFETFLRKITRDSLVQDQVAVEIVPTFSGKPAFFQAVDSATIRLARQNAPAMDDRGYKDPSGGDSAWQTAVRAVQEMMAVKEVGSKKEVPAAYVQLLEGTVRQTFSNSELWFGIRNPRTDLFSAGYGMSELEILISVITSILWAEEYNRKIFSTGSIPKGILNIKGEISELQMNAFRREWTNLVSGVSNAWKTPLINAEDLDYINLQGSSRDMEYTNWLLFLVRITSAIYLIDPAEIGFDMPKGIEGGQAQPMIESSSEAKLRASRDKGLTPLLRFIARGINENIIWKLDPDFQFEWVGLDARSVDQEIQDSVERVGSYMTLNEVRATNDLEPLPNGDVVLNPIYLSILEQAQEAEQQEQMAELATKNPDAALVMQGIDPKSERMKASAEAQATKVHGEAKAGSEELHGKAKAQATIEHGKAKAQAAKSGTKGKSTTSASSKKGASKSNSRSSKSVKKSFADLKDRLNKAIG